jgi:hypothetical protein
VVAWFRLDEALGGPGQMTSYAADWSPDASAPRGFVWPIDLATGEVIAPVWARWVARSPFAWLDDAAFVERARGAFSGRILVAASPGDEFDLYEPAARFSERLTEVGVEHRFVTTEGGHGDVAPRFLAVVEFAAEHLRPAAP